MQGVLKGVFLALNSNDFNDKTYYKALFLTDNNGKYVVEYVSISNERLEQIKQLTFGQSVELLCDWSVFEGKGKWRY